MKKDFFSSYTGVLIGANIVAFVLIMIIASVNGNESVATLFALKPADIIMGNNLWTLFTSVFAHVWIWHLFVNMFTLFFIGKFVEKLIGKKRFLALYLISGVFAGLFWVLGWWLFGGSVIGMKIFGDPFVSGLGASGALFGLIGVLAMLTPRAKVYLIAGPLIAIILQFVLSGFINGDVMNLLSLLINIYFMFSLIAILFSNSNFRRFALPVEMPFWALPIVAIVPLVLIGLFVELPIGNMAHLGGLIVGLGYGFYLKKMYPRKTKMISKYFSR